MMIASGSVQLGNPVSDKERVAELLRLASTHSAQYQYELSRRYAEEALQTATRIGDMDAVANAHLYLGIYFFMNENIEEAHRHFAVALELAEKNKIQSLKLRTLGNIGNLQYRAKNFEDAKTYYNRALKLATLLKDKKTIATAWQSLGNSNYALGDSKTAEKNFEKARGLAKELQDENLLSYTLLGLGAIAIDRGEQSKGYEYLRESLRIGQELGNMSIVISTYKALAEYSSSIGKNDEAVMYLETALTIAEKGNLKYSISDLYLALSRLHEKNDDDFTAYDYYDRFVLLRDVIYNEESNVKIAEMQSLYELELKKKEAEIIRIKTEELQQAKDETESALQKLRAVQLDLIEMERRNLSLVMAVTANHEINQPLMIIKGNLELFEQTLKTGATDSQQKHILRVNESIDRMEEILMRYNTLEEPQPFSEK